MNWDAIGAIAELLGAIGVIASLVYLATQIRHGQEQMSQNTRAVRASAYQQFEHSQAERAMLQFSTPGLSRNVDSAMTDFQQLSGEDRSQVLKFCYLVLRGFDNAYYQFRTGMLDEERWHLAQTEMKWMLELPFFPEWWDATGHQLSPEFVALVEEILGENDPAESNG